MTTYTFASAFGANLLKYSRLRDPTGADKKMFEQEFSFVNTSALHDLPHQNFEMWGYASHHLYLTSSTWTSVRGNLTCIFGPELEIPRREGVIVGDVLSDPYVLDSIWQRTDEELWEAAKKLDKPGHPGLVAKTFGLLDPRAPDRPTCSEYFFKVLQEEAEAIAKGMDARLRPETTPAPAPAPPVLLNSTSTTESMVQSGHKFLSEQEVKGKEKMKTRGAPVSSPKAQEDQYDEEDTTDIQNFPDLLPSSYKMGRKVLKVMLYSHHLLSHH